ncbi:MAG TPA: DUF4332 domain-containing protein [Candidatus Bathyarchaeia archaeon]|nr:DUF4332 domain-containing protein [Candidatus Bathyarchaeia archaeon]
MDKEGYIQYLKSKRKENAINSYLQVLALLESYLADFTQKRDIDKITKDEFNDFVTMNKSSFKSYQTLTPIRDYYAYKGNEELEYLCNQYMGSICLETYKLSEFMGVEKLIISKLKKIGITTAHQMLEKGAKKEGRKLLSEQSGIQEEKILELVKLSNLARVPGHKKKRTRLYYEAGVDTFDKMAKLTPEELIKISEKYIEKSGFDGSAPIYADARFSIENAKRLPRIIEF